MSRRILSLIALLLVTDAIVVHGRGPRPSQIVAPDAGETARLGRQYVLPRI
ncbi:hypothetical protein U8607_19955 [Methylobacterium durans]|jgi:hypothetical protein|uniref:hypothetical protein n=1 Tax=Methylobacterium durans TaxID=2202825 RepID=UPI0013A53FE1|nr:hypothetical protein [Methylobacterium durans]MEA1834374.1 hypothetical protein [Methylobacterium durans]